MAAAGGGMAPQFWALRCCCCRLFQVLVFITFVQVYGQGSGLDCRRHVQKLNLLQGEAEEAMRFLFIQGYFQKSKSDNLGMYMQCFRVKLWEENSLFVHFIKKGCYFCSQNIVKFKTL
uniref:MRN complex-interacting protein N-terminal domain-containing protein n=1 Tax=Strix occidentalis caurina TaxID=311401 RepID=A0A8D0FDJ5_STROC